MRRITKTVEPVEGMERVEGVESLAAPLGSAGKRKRRERRELVKLTLEIPHELHFRIMGIAAKEKMRKGAFIEKLLKQGCASFKIDEGLKAIWGETQGQNVSAA